MKGVLVFLCALLTGAARAEEALPKFTQSPSATRTGDKVRITSRRGEATLRARVVDMPRPGMCFAPFHWEDEASLVNKVTIDAYDPGSKQPEFKICAVKLAKA